MIKNTTKSKTTMVIKAAFDSKSLNKDVLKTKNKVTEFISKKEAFIYLGKETGLIFEDVIQAGKAIASHGRDLQIDVKSFITKKLDEKKIIDGLVQGLTLVTGKVFTLKTAKKAKEKTFNLINLTKEGTKEFKRLMILEDARVWVRSMQVCPPNIQNSVNLAAEMKKELSKFKNLSVKVLTKKQMKDLGMGLALGVNAGSAHDARIVIAEYKGDAKSKDKTAIIGKGIIFDSGGYNLKPASFIKGMKFDMSGAAIVAGTMKSIAQTKPKSNFSGVMVLTDNKIGKDAQLTDSVQTAMNGKTVEINNTDAEGRLVMADGITYAVRKMKATRIMDVATLTGAVLSALGNTYTGVWSTTEKGWKAVDKASEKSNENVWRMPLHRDYAKFIKSSPIADLRNTDLTGKGGSSSAAMFLLEFSEGVEHIHFDVAGTADVNGEAMAPMLKTFVEMAHG